MKMVYMMIVSMLLHTQMVDANVENAFTRLLVTAVGGDEITVELGKTNPKIIKVHDQHKWRYLNKLFCKNKNGSCICTIKIKNEKHKPTIFSILEHAKEERNPKVIGYIKIEG